MRLGAGLIGIDRSKLELSTEVTFWQAFTDWRWKNQSCRYNRNRIVNHRRYRTPTCRFLLEVAVFHLDVLTRIQSFLVAPQAWRIHSECPSTIYTSPMT
jgi:hypothetical protein